MKELYDKILGSFDNGPKGFSSKKLTAFIIVTMVVVSHIKWIALGNFTQLEMVLTIDYAFIAALFGMTTYSSMKSQAKEQPAPPVDKIDPVVDVPVDAPIDADKPQ